MPEITGVVQNRFDENVVTTTVDNLVNWAYVEEMLEQAA